MHNGRIKNTPLETAYWFRPPTWQYWRIISCRPTLIITRLISTLYATACQGH